MAATHYITFWEFIRTQKIEIPIIQRDYAQGRNGHEKLREKFLKDLKSALDKPEQNLKLDFVYGSLENEKLQPLDGQQRLTTLWLLHWYISFKAGILLENKEIENLLKKFSYETRTSSREFCFKLSEFNIKQPIENDKILGIVEHIQNQTWFYSAWKQDPTIQAMLNMLGGTDVKEKDTDIIDGIEELFKDITKDQFVKYWEIFTGEKCPIIFYYMPLNELKLSDDLYIKMNARGKPLTSFENFKADLTGFIKKKIEENTENDKWKSLDINDIEHKLDTDWTDIFWKNKSIKYEIDEIYFAFINRFFLNKLITAKNAESNEFQLTPEQLENHESYKFLIGKTGNDSEIKYTSFDYYNPKKDNNPIFNDSIYNQLKCILDNFHNSFLGNNKLFSKEEINIIFSPNWENKMNFNFIPSYVKNSKANDSNNEPKFISDSLSSLQLRAVFHAICCYFEKNTYEEILFKQWMRVVWNIVENAPQSMIRAIRLIDNLGMHSNDIYFHIKDRDVSKDFAKDQMEEEKEKARQIIDFQEWKDSKGCSWEDKITEAEKWAFFNGAIRFLFKDSENKYNWGDFNVKFENCQKYFNKDGVKDGNRNYKDEAILLKALISRCSDFNQYIWHEKYIFDNEAKTWKEYLLLKSEWAFAVNEVLLGNLEIMQPDTTLLYRNLYQTNLLNYVAKEMPGARMRWIHGHHAIYQPYREGILLDDNSESYSFKRNEILSFLIDKNNVECDRKISNCNFFWGWDIYFKYKNIVFQWNTDNKIYVIQNGNWKKNEEGNLVNYNTNDLLTEPYQNLIDWINDQNNEG